MRVSIIRRQFSSKVKQSAKDTKNVRQEEILLLSHETAARYYKLNVPFLFGYIGFAGVMLNNPEYPAYVKSSMLMFSSLCGLGLVGLFLYSNRHIKTMKLIKPGNNLIIETFSKFGFSSKNHNINVNDIKELIPISKYIHTKKTGIYMMTLYPEKKLFNSFNVLFMRPSKNNPQFDKIFIAKLKK